MAERTKVVHVGKLFEKLPPHAVEAEVALLGTLMLHPQAMQEAVQVLRGPEEFYNQRNAAIYAAMVDLWDAGTLPDATAVFQRLKDCQSPVLGSSENFLNELVEICESGTLHTMVGYYAKVVRDKAALRELADRAGKILYECYHASDEAEEVRARAIDAMVSLQGHTGATPIVEQGELVNRVYDEIGRRREQPEPEGLGVPTGIVDLDAKLVGLEPGTLTILAARTSVGKTSLALQIAGHTAEHGAKPLVFCLEMNRDQMGYRLLAAASSISAWSLRRARVSEDDFATLFRVVSRLSNLPIRYAMTPGLTLSRLRTVVVPMVRAGKCSIVFIDHLGLMRAPRAENRNLALGEITIGVKTLAEELQIPIVMLAQLNREADKRDKNRPHLSDIRESGHIEEDADNVVLLHRPEYYERHKPGYVQPAGELEPAFLYLDKNRQGPTGVIEVWFDPSTMTFKNRQHHLYGGAVA